MRSDYDMEGPLGLLLKIRSFISKSLGYSHITGQNNVWQNYGRSYVENFPSIGLRSRVLQTRLWAQTSPTSGRISDPSKIPNGRPPRLPARNDQTNPRPNRKESFAAACDSTPPLGSVPVSLPETPLGLFRSQILPQISLYKKKIPHHIKIPINAWSTKCR
jgi:hypothetical protein